MLRRGCALVAIAILGGTVLPAVAATPAPADAPVTIVVTTTEDTVDPGDGETSLREAISAAGALTTADGTSVDLVLEPGAHYALTTCDGTRDSEDDSNSHGDLDHAGALPLGVRVPPPSGVGMSATIAQTCGAESGERVLDVMGSVGLYAVDLTGGDSTSDGGGLRAGGSVSLEEASVTGNLADGRGGGVAAAGHVQVDSGARVSGNESGGPGGGVAADTVSVVGSYYPASVTNNVSAGDGGGIHASTSTTVGSDTAVVGNRAGGDGGAISAPSTRLGETGVDPDLGGPVLRGNSAGGDGGAVAADVLDAVGTTMVGNGALGHGGAVRSGSITVADSDLTGELLLDRTWVRANEAEGVSGLDVTGAGPTWVRNSAIVENDSGDGEGALRYPAAPGDHLLQLSTLAGQGPLLASAGSGPRVAGVLFAGPGTSCDVAGPLLLPDPLTAPPEALGRQPSYAVDGSCQLPEGSTDGGPPIGFETDPGSAYVPVWDSPTIGAVQLPVGAELGALEDGPYPVERVVRPVGPGADIGAREQGEPLVHPMGPRRLLDTRSAGGPLGPGGTTEVQIGGVFGIVPLGARGAVVNVTLVDPSAATHLTVWPSDVPRPASSTVNAPAGTTVAASTMVRLSDDGTITVRNSAGDAHVLVDLVAWIMEPDDSASGGLAVTPVAPARLIDTRAGASLDAGETRLFDVDGGVVPTGADAVVVNLTGVVPSTATHLTVWQAGAPRPATSSLNVAAGATVANLAVVPLDAQGRLAVRNQAGTVHVLGDVVGYLDEVSDDAASADSGVRPLVPRRAFDSRAPGNGALVAGTVRTVDLTDWASGYPLPAHARAALVTLTVVSPSADAHLTAWAAGAPRPTTSNVNVPAGVTRANASLVPLDGEGRIDLRLSAGDAHVIVDVVGYLD